MASTYEYKGGTIMSGTKAGGEKTKETIYKKHGKDYYKKIGAKGGRNGHTGGFASNPELAKIAGRKGRINRTIKEKSEE